MADGLHIGLIGGIGPAATIVYYQRLTDAMRQRGKTLELTIVQADVNELIQNSLADNRAKQAEVYAKLIDRLRAAGAECAAITSLGGHFCFDETAERSALPLVSAVAPLDDYFAAQGVQRVGLLGTEIVMRTRLYGQLEKTEAVSPADNLSEVGAAYREMAVRGDCTDADRTLFFAAGQQMIEAQAAQAIVLAGTDLNLAYDDHDPGYPVIDALDVHVAVLAEIAAGNRPL